MLPPPEPDRHDEPGSGAVAHENLTADPSDAPDARGATTSDPSQPGRHSPFG